jgi:hypothetical protein
VTSRTAESDFVKVGGGGGMLRGACEGANVVLRRA